MLKEMVTELRLSMKGMQTQNEQLLTKLSGEKMKVSDCERKLKVNASDVHCFFVFGCSRFCGVILSFSCYCPLFLLLLIFLPSCGTKAFDGW